MTRYFMSEEGEMAIVEKISNSSNEQIARDDVVQIMSALENLSGERRPNAVLEISKEKIESKGIVGIIQADNCSLEILPKIDIKSADEKDRNLLLRNRLVHMISTALNLRIDLESQSSLGSQDETLLELLISKFANKLADTVRHGLPQKYIQKENDLPLLRGSLNIIRQLSVHSINPSRLACRYEEFSSDIMLNQIMKTTIDFLSKKTNVTESQMLLRDLSLVFADITRVPIDRIRWDLITIDRTNEKWEELYTFAKLFLNSRYQNTTFGSNDGYSLLFKMSELFEKYISRLIQWAVSDTNYSVEFQGEESITLFDRINKPVNFKAKPDVLICLENKVDQVIDAKWKFISDKQRRNWSVNEDDIYQVIAYSRIYDANRTTLVYPHNSELGKEGYQLTGQIGNEKELQLDIFTIDLSANEFNESDETKRIAKLLSRLD